MPDYKLGIQVGLKETASKGFRQIESSARSSLGKIGGIATSTGLKLAAALGVTGVVAASVSAVRSLTNALADYEAGIALATTTTGASGKQFDVTKRAMFDYGLQLARRTTIPIQDMTKGFYELASAGLSADEVTKAMRGTLALAESSGADLAMSAALVTSAMKAFGLQASDTDRIVNVLSATAASSMFKIGELAVAFPYAAGTAGMMNMSLEQLAGSLAVLRNLGHEASTTGSETAMMLVQLARVAEGAGTKVDALGFAVADANDEDSKAAAVLKRHGIEARQLDVKTRGLTAVVKTLADAHLTLGEVMDLTGMRGARALMGFMIDPSQIDQQTAAVTGTVRAYEMQAKIQETIAGRYQMMKNYMTAALITTVAQSGPMITQLFDTMIKGFDKIMASGALQSIVAWLGREIPVALAAVDKWIKEGGMDKFLQDAAKAARELGAALKWAAEHWKEIAVAIVGLKAAGIGKDIALGAGGLGVGAAAGVAGRAGTAAVGVGGGAAAATLGLGAAGFWAGGGAAMAGEWAARRMGYRGATNAEMRELLGMSGVAFRGAKARAVAVEIRVNDPRFDAYVDGRIQQTAQAAGY